MSDLPLRVRVSTGGYDNPGLEFDAASPADVVAKLKGLADEGVYQALVDASSMMRIALGVAEPVQQQPQSGGWSVQPPQQTVTGNPQQPQSGGWRPPGWPDGGPQLGDANPAGETCISCGQVLRYRVINRKSDGKQFKFWACPNQSSPNDGHDSKFA